MKAKSILPSAIVISTLLIHLTFAALPRYEITDLGTLGGYSSYAHAINDTGQVVGRVDTTNLEFRAFLWDSNTGMIDLGSLGELWSDARGINNNGKVVGRLFLPGGQPRAFIWDSTAGMVELGAGVASCINNAGQIAGQFPTVYDPTAHHYRSHACIWDSANGMIDLGTLGSPCPNSTCPDHSRALGINDAGQVVGVSLSVNGSWHAFLWDSAKGMCDLGTLGGSSSGALSINNFGQIVGNSSSVNGDMHAFLWDSISDMRDLGTLGGNDSYAYAINDHGQVVGYSYTIDNDYDSIRAFVWDSNNGMIRLDELLSADSGWTGLRPHAINNRGQIVGYGINKTLQRRAAFLMTPIPPKTIYVDDDAAGANDGSSWADAFNYLQDALAAALSGDEIRVAQGIYKPDQGAGITPGDREATFQLINGVTIKGGYAGYGQPDPNVRNITTYKTILSGDLNSNDVDVFDPRDLLDEPTRAENSYHVVTGSGTEEAAVMDGFTITGGNTSRDYPDYYGGGMYNDDTSPILTNCVFSGNSARLYGGGMANRNSSPVLTNCTFINNSAGEGGGMYNSDSSPTVIQCTFNSNTAVFDGGGMYNTENSNAILTSCSFRGNSASWNGGGISNFGSSPMVMNCMFGGNSAVWGGGIYNYESDLMMTNCIVSGNRARWSGGGIYLWTGIPSPGGPCYVKRTCNVTLISCTFSENQAEHGRALACGSCYGLFPSKVQIANCILWDGGDEIRNYDGSTIKINYSDVWDGFLGEGNIDSDPLFVEPGYWALGDDPNIFVEPNDPNAVWIEGDYHLLLSSPCIDAGDPNYVPGPNETDLDGGLRVIGGRIDMGAYEAPIFAEARILPRTINLASKGKWITAYIWLPEGYDVADIDPNSVFLEDEIKPEDFSVDEHKQV
ncbi:MAG: DUF3466 family protein, partial [Planctomycetota bacterium]